MSTNRPNVDMEEYIEHVLQQQQQQQCRRSSSSNITAAALRDLNFAEAPTRTDVVARTTTTAAAAADDDEENEDGREEGDMLFSTATRPYISEEVGGSSTPTASKSPIFCLKCAAAGDPIAAATTDNEEKSKQPRAAPQQPQRRRSRVQTTTTTIVIASSSSSSSPQSGRFPFPHGTQVSVDELSLQGSSSDVHARLGTRCPPASPFFLGGLLYCLTESTVAETASPTTNSFSHGCCGGVTSTVIEGYPVVPSAVSKTSSLSVVLRMPAGEGGSPLLNSCFVPDTEEGRRRGQHASSLSPSSPPRLWVRNGTTAAPVKTSAYMRFERAVQDTALSCDDAASATEALLAAAAAMPI
ncbi:hypothetical protein ABB37_08298 [Leptomonas pyrrhocoris]|uniref:Uncharacterized protein n=1 Tax=Leptomonas pyrrhocoris TaxID=157538 RepID=A0A0M9FTL2_LEPPY|nr:hypothetical protein ABB37_08298 [Leptomonas pyrrhocoris]KPA75763.1 hypothetical protein ABB37_08298 [Leptomonas pyrrhocoris]|eukprot:XP_015654202.1 hypothetical protein ABB37_08298 [Leptomonas pyrrhocoris]